MHEKILYNINCLNNRQLGFNLLEDLIQIAEQAGKLILEIYNQNDYEIKIKNDNSPLTIADKKSHNFIVSKLNKNFPSIPVISEEGDGINYDKRKGWKDFS